MVKEVLKILKKNYPEAKCELNYQTPFELLIATILSAQCTDERVNKVTKRLFQKAKTPEEILNLGLEQLRDEIKECGLFNSKSKNIIACCQELVEKHGSKVPDNLAALTSLAGVGRKTANVVLSNAFNIPAIAVDTHVFRVANRIGLVDAKNVEETEKGLMAVIPKEDWTLSHHLLIFHGRRLCTARSPKCHLCPLTKFCKFYNIPK
ncbi:endonuclease III [Anaerobranca gottschalkii]|uniref:Endonuclease III n=1 Tax=Anaerobranca gottschalkii DSM 13577 TaxID=1120990 RepID=A0A1I0AZ65_9FIRM|nr:endonuclease III [Anaerobranca gottschalkii]SES99703.1 DNA-(apurinic or apyrimidinic site) lyase /endonuclease III [Anaerobranca gottschalkii DSM 13577]